MLHYVFSHLRILYSIILLTGIYLSDLVICTVHNIICHYYHPYTGMQRFQSGSTAVATNSALVHQLLNTVQSLPTVKKRAVYAVVGAAVADAAIRPFHWVYDRPTLEAALGDNVRSRTHQISCVPLSQIIYILKHSRVQSFGLRMCLLFMKSRQVGDLATMISAYPCCGLYRVEGMSISQQRS